MQSAAASMLASPVLFGCKDQITDIRHFSIPPLGPVTSPVSAIHSLLEDLRQAYENKGQHVTPTLLPGLAGQDLAKKCSWFPEAIPFEVAALYAWRNGQKNDPWNEKYPFWIGDNGFTSVENAEGEYKSMMASYGKELPPHLIGVDLRYCFPFAAFNGGWYVFPCRGQAINKGTARPVISVFQGVDVMYDSVETMLKTSVAWVKDPTYGQEETKAKKSESHRIKIWLANNPGVRKDFEEKQKQHGDS